MFFPIHTHRRIRSLTGLIYRSPILTPIRSILGPGRCR